MGLLRPRAGKIDDRFLLYAYLGPAFQETLRSRTIHGSTVDRIPLIDMADLFPDRFEDSELSEIPAGWEVKSFADTVEIIGGGTPKTSVAEYWEGDIPWFSVVDAPSGADVWVVDTEKDHEARGRKFFIARATRWNDDHLRAGNSRQDLACWRANGYEPILLRPARKVRKPRGFQLLRNP